MSAQEITYPFLAALVEGPNRVRSGIVTLRDTDLILREFGFQLVKLETYHTGLQAFYDSGDFAVVRVKTRGAPSGPWINQAHLTIGIQTESLGQQHEIGKLNSLGTIMQPPRSWHSKGGDAQAALTHFGYRVRTLSDDEDFAPQFASFLKGTKH